jgi:predicted metal-dependent hydrolase
MNPVTAGTTNPVTAGTTNPVTAGTTNHISIGRTRLAYELIFSHRRTFGIIIERDQRVVVRAPEGMTRQRIEALLEKKKMWLYEKIRHPKKYPLQPTRKEVVSGESLLFLGQHYLLELIETKNQKLELDSGFKLPRHLSHSAAQIFKNWYIRQARDFITPRVQKIAQALGVNYNKILISDLKYRWGSCTPNDNLNFNWRIIKAPAFVIDYIIVHELTHLLEANHTKRFWNIVAIQVPKYKEAKAWLADNGHVLETDF